MIISGDVSIRFVLKTMAITWLYLLLSTFARQYSLMTAVLFYTLILFFIRKHIDILKPYIVPPLSDARLPVFVNKPADLLLIYPFFLVAAINIINRALIFSGIVPEDPQRLGAIGSTFAGFAARCFAAPFIALTEELLNLLVFLAIYKLLCFMKTGRLACSIIIASLAFGLLHSLNWGPAAALTLGVSFIPVFLALVYTGKLWTGVFAHMFLDILASARIHSLAAYRWTAGLFALSVLLCSLWAFMRKRS